MDNQEYRKVSKAINNYKTARMGILIFIILTAVNMVMIATENGYFMFSVYICNLFVSVGAVFKNELGEKLYLVVGLILAAIILIVYVIMWFVSKKHRWGMITLLVLFGIDTVLVVVSFISLLLDGEFGSVVELVFHGLALYYLIVGVTSASSLIKHFPQGVSLTRAQLDEAYNLENAEANPAMALGGMNGMNGMPMNGMPMGMQQPMQRLNVPDSVAIGADDGKGRAWVTAQFDGRNIYGKVSTFGGKASLVIDGNVYATEKLSVFKGEKRMSAVLSGVEYVLECVTEATGQTYTLYANGRIIASNNRMM